MDKDKKYKGELIVRTGEYQHIKVFPEDTLEGILNVNDKLQNMVADRDGLNQLDWAKFRNNFYWKRGKLDPDMQETMAKLSKTQRFVINELKLSIRAEEPEIEEVDDEIKLQEEHIKSIT